MKHAKQLNPLTVDPVRHEVRSAGDDEFPRRGDESTAPHLGMIRQAPYGAHDTARHVAGGARTVLLDEGPNLHEIPDGLRCPDDGHRGGSVS